MKVEESLKHMSSMYLKRTAGSFLTDVGFTDEEEMRDAILRNIPEFANKERVQKKLDFLEEDRDVEVVNHLVLISLLESEDYLDTKPSLMSRVHNLEESILGDSRDVKYMSEAIPPREHDVYEAVLQTAWAKDNSLNPHEKNILRVLREKLGLTRRHHHLIESVIGRFPRHNNKKHSHDDIEFSLKNLQMRGLILRIKPDKNSEYFLVPEEIVTTIRYSLGTEIRSSGFASLLNKLTIDQIRNVLRSFSLPVGGAKSELIERIIHFELRPSHVLDSLSNQDLRELLVGLDRVRVSGSKAERIQRLIDHFEKFGRVAKSDPTDSRSLYYDYIAELANRDRTVLRGNGVVDKDLEMDNYFEDATNYLFEEKLGIKPDPLEGSQHADGRLLHNSKEVVLWDNKSTEEPYSFPQAHFDQFLRYIRAEQKRPTLFLVIVGAIDNSNNTVENNAQRLKSTSPEDTDVAIICAEDLKFVAENWRSFSDLKTPRFNLEVFNMTGVLSREKLKNSMSWALTSAS